MGVAIMVLASDFEKINSSPAIFSSSNHPVCHERVILYSKNSEKGNLSEEIKNHCYKKLIFNKVWNTHMINQYSRRNLFSEFPGHVIWYCTISKRSSRFKSFCGKTTTTEPLSIESPWPCLRLYLVIMGCFGIGGVRLKNLQKGHIHISRVPKFSFHYNKRYSNTKLRYSKWAAPVQRPFLLAVRACFTCGRSLVLL